MAKFSNISGLYLLEITYLFIAIALYMNVYAADDIELIKKTADLDNVNQSSIIGSIATFAWNTFCVIGPIIQYYPSLKDVFSLSHYVIFILLLSNIIRICYWFAEPFEVSLLLQSFVMIFMQSLLLKELVYQYKQQIKQNKRQPLTIWYDGLNLTNFCFGT